MKQYLDMVDHVLSNGSWKSPVRKNNEGKWEPVDGGVKTLACPNVFFSHNMSDGFPLLTTKKMAWKTLKVELEGFINGITDKSWYQDRGCKIWNEWGNPEKVQNIINEQWSLPHFDDDEGNNTDYLKFKKSVQRKEKDLGPIYGFQFRNFGDYTYDLKVVLPKKPSDESLLYKPNYKIVNKSKIEKSIPQGNDNHGRPLVKVYLSSGFEKIVRKDQKIVSDPYEITYGKVGYLGELNGIDKKTNLYKNIYKCWSHVINRCYNPSCKKYKFYGEKGVYVAPSWHNFTNFYNDVKNIIGYSYKLRNLNEYQLDKDHFQSNCYSKETCVWLPGHMNAAYASCQPFIAISPKGKIHEHISPTKFAELHDLNGSCITRCLRGDREYHKGWKFKKTYNKNYRFKVPVDQLYNIVQTLRNNPMDRRMVCSAWNPTILDQAALPSCHYVWNVTVIDNKVNLFWAQRSADLMLGVPFNIASYGLLLSLLALDSGLEVGNLSGCFVDCHIYENQIEAAKEQITRSPQPLPKINTQWDAPAEGSPFDIFKWTHVDTILKNYKPLEKIDFGEVVV